eukprot:TRINITY_DN33806_c0_g1_i2.p1 TRINITY_DN33806_c0_g1~~TRINITY_DN33806_c0_g1_i2.p1  ORF type:complete len:535 (-),score=67.46 TRINITY_DN33806_c0_g1_i2:282-1814(-)
MSGALLGDRRAHCGPFTWCGAQPDPSTRVKMQNGAIPEPVVQLVKDQVREVLASGDQYHNVCADSVSYSLGGHTTELHGMVIALQDEVTRLNTGLRIAQASITEATNASQGLFVTLQDEVDDLRAELCKLRPGNSEQSSSAYASGTAHQVEDFPSTKVEAPTDLSLAKDDAPLAPAPLSADAAVGAPAFGLERCTLPKSIYGDVVLSLCAPRGRRSFATCPLLLVMLLCVLLNVALQASVAYAIGRYNADHQDGWQSKLSACSQISKTCLPGTSGCCSMAEICGQSSWTFACDRSWGLSGLGLSSNCRFEEQYLTYAQHRDLADWSWPVALAAVLCLWHCRVLRELLGALYLGRLVAALPRSKQGVDRLAWHDGTPELVAVPGYVKLLTMVILVPLKLVLLVGVYWVGAQLLMSMTTVKDLVLHVIMLEFVWQIDDLLFLSIVPGTRRRLLQTARPSKIRHCFPRIARSSMSNFFMVAVVAGGSAAVLWWQYWPMYLTLSDTVLDACKVA